MPGDIVEEASGVPFEEFVRQYILDPLGLANTRTELPEDLYGQELATGYTALNREHQWQKVALFKHIEGDTFRRVREDGELGETLVFERNDSGQITRLKNHGIYSTRMIL